MLKQLLGLAPTREADGSYSPSKVALKLATVKTTDFDNPDYPQVQGTRSKVLVIFTEQKDMEMKNGKRFSTGNHPVEALVPMLHLRNAGFAFDIATPTGKPVVFEMWAFPSEDDHVQAIFDAHRAAFEQPLDLRTVAEQLPENGSPYAAVFVPGGHGSMLGIPEDQNVKTTLEWAHGQGLYTISLCHGPGSFLTTQNPEGKFMYDGYRMAVFPDSVDRMTPMIGYLPGHMPHGLSETLKGMGAEVVNAKGDDTVCRDRTLITGASPLASNKLGKLAVETLLATTD